MAFSPDGRWIASGSGFWGGTDLGEVRVWDAETGQTRYVLDPKAGAVYCVAFDPKSETLLSGHHDGAVRSWSLRDGSLNGIVAKHHSGVHGVAFNAAGDAFATTSLDQSAQIHWLKTGSWRVLSGHTDGVFGASFSPDGRLLATCSRDHTLRLWDARTGEPVRRLGCRDDIRRVAYSPDGSRIAGVSYQGRVLIWDAADLDSPPVSRHAGCGPLLGVAFTPDGRDLLWCGHSGSVCLDRISDGFKRRQFVGHDGGVIGVAMSPDGRWAATASSDSTVRIWNAWTVNTDSIRRAAGVRGSVNNWRTGIRDLGRDADGKLVGMAGAGREVELWYLESGARIRGLLHKSGKAGVSLRAAALAAGRRQLAAAFTDGSIVCWDLDSGESRWSVDLSCSGLAWSPDETMLAAAGEDGALHLVDPVDGKSTRRIGAGAPLVGVAFTPDGDRVAVADVKRMIRIWNFRKGTEASNFSIAQSDAVEESPAQEAIDVRLSVRLSFTRDGRRLAVASRSRPLEIWDAVSGRIALTLPFRDGEEPHCAQFDGDRLYAVDHSAYVRTYDASPDPKPQPPGSPEEQRIAMHKRQMAESWSEADWDAVEFHAQALARVEPRVAQHQHDIAQSLAQRKLFAKARAAFDLAVSLGKAESAPFALECSIVINDQDDLRRRCRAICAAAEHSDLAFDLNTAAWCCTVLPDSGVPHEQILALAEKACDLKKNVYEYLNTLGSCLYRCGRYRESVDTFERAVARRGGRGLPHDWLFLAMAHAHLGDQAKSDAYWYRARSEPDMEGWRNREELRILFAEAERTLSELRARVPKVGKPADRKPVPPAVR